MVKHKTNPHPHKIPLMDAKGKKSDSIELNKEIFKGEVNKTLLYQALNMYRANTRRGTASSKNRSEVRGSGKKPWRQKGTGRARFGSKRNPVWRGGGVAFGPRPRDFRYQLPKKMKRNAFITSINAKLNSGKVTAVEKLVIGEPKTKHVVRLLKNLKLSDRVLLLVDKIDRNLMLSTRNIEKLTLRKINEATAYDVLANDHIIMTKDGADALNKSVTT